MENLYCEPMDYEYSRNFSSGQYQYTPPPKDAFKIPESFFEPQYKKSNIIANVVCDLFSSVKLDDDVQKEGTKQESNVEPEEPKLSRSRSVSPQRNSPEPITPQSIIEAQPVEQTDIPTAPVIIPASSDTTQHTHHHQYNFPSYTQQPHCTYVYHAPSPIDPLSQSRGTIHFISGLVKIAGTTVVSAGAIYLLSQFVMNMQEDMGSKVAKYESELLGNQFYCQQQYSLNKCSPDSRLPAIVDLCREWEQCMLRPLTVSKSKVLAETFADIANGFSDTLSTKSLICSLLFGFAIIWAFSNIFKNQARIQQTAHHYQSASPPVPATNVPIKRLQLEPYQD